MCSATYLWDSILILFLSLGEGNDTPLQYSSLEDPMDGGAWWAAAHGVATSRTRLHFHFHFSLSCFGGGNGNPLQNSCLENPRDRGAWWAAVHGVAKSPAGLSDFTFTFMRWRRKWQPSPVFLPGESQGQGAWWAAIYGVTQSRTRVKRLSSSSSSVLAWRIPWTEETRGLQYIGLQGIGYDWESNTGPP